MAKDVQEIAKELLLNALDGDSKSSDNGKGRHGMSGATGMMAGAGAAALAPMAFKHLAKALGVNGAAELVKSPGKTLGNITSDLGESVGSGLGDKVTSKIDEAGGPQGILSGAVKDVLPFGGGSGGGGGDANVPGVGKGRRMPVQQSIDIGAPLETVYNQWTQVEDWPAFMHRVTRASQEDDCKIACAVKIWGMTKEFTAEIETQRPNERIKWRVTQGMSHTGVVSFHELGPNLTRVLLSLDVDPGSLIEKAARGMRLVKRAVRGDLHRFKAFIEMTEQETGAWRGRIEDGEVVEEHDPDYDKKREYADLDELIESAEAESGAEDDEDDQDEADEEPEDTAPRTRGRSTKSRSTSGSKSRSTSGSKGGSSRESSRSTGGVRTRGRAGSSSKSASSGSGSRSRSGSATSKSSGRRTQTAARSKR
jgi:uncharacterized membrane protein